MLNYPILFLTRCNLKNKEIYKGHHEENACRWVYTWSRLNKKKDYKLYWEREMRNVLTLAISMYKSLQAQRTGWSDSIEELLWRMSHNRKGG